MLYKLVLNILKKHYGKFSLEQKKEIRKLANGKAIDEKAKRGKDKRSKIMELEQKTEKEEQKKVEAESNEVEKGKETEQSVEKKADSEGEKETDTEKETKGASTETEEKTTEQVIDTPPTGNGVRVEDLVTIEMLNDKLSALIAKFDAVVKENSDLKDALDKKGDELSKMQDKYENRDFGGSQKRGMDSDSKYANDTFEEYAKQFM